MATNKKVMTLAVEGATVIINGEERDTYCAAYGTLINWSVSKEGYETQSGSFVLTEDKTLDVVLVPVTNYYTFAINATPSDATVVINDEVRTSIEVASGTTVSWSVSKEGYVTQSGSQVVTTNTTKEIVLEEEAETFEPLVLTLNNSDGMDTPKVLHCEDTTEEFCDSDGAYLLGAIGGSMDIEVNGTLYENVVPNAGDSYEIGGLVSGENVLKFYPKDETTRFAFNGYAYQQEGAPSRHIVSIDQWGDSRFTNLYFAFAYDALLKSVAKPEKSKTFAELTDINRAFYYCTSLEAVPDSLFEDVGGTLNAKGLFEQGGLLAVPKNLFGTKAETDATNLCFKSKIVTVPEGCFENSKVTTFESVFDTCTALETVGANAFKGCTSALSFNGAFYDCSSLKSIPDTLFAGCENAQDFSFVFMMSGLEAIPEGLFADCKAMTSAMQAFAYYLGETVPDGLFKGFENLTDIERCFSMASNLKEVGASLFEGCVSLESAPTVFENTTQLNKIGANLFKGCSALKSAVYCFYNVGTANAESTTVTFGDSIFEGTALEIGNRTQRLASFVDAIALGNRTFANCTSADFSYLFECTTKAIGEETFAGCANLIYLMPDFFFDLPEGSILPANTLKGCVSLQYLTEIFYHAHGLASVEEGFLDDCGELIYVALLFMDTYSITSVPSNIFSKCPKISDFFYCFFRNGFTDPDTAYIEGESPYDLVEIDGVATKIHLYERANYPDLYPVAEEIDGDACFAYQTHLTDYDEIPDTWK